MSEHHLLTTSILFACTDHNCFFPKYPVVEGIINLVKYALIPYLCKIIIINLKLKVVKVASWSRHHLEHVG